MRAVGKPPGHRISCGPHLLIIDTAPERGPPAQKIWEPPAAKKGKSKSARALSWAPGWRRDAPQEAPWAQKYGAAKAATKAHDAPHDDSSDPGEGGCLGGGVKQESSSPDGSGHDGFAGGADMEEDVEDAASGEPTRFRMDGEDDGMLGDSSSLSWGEDVTGTGSFGQTPRRGRSVTRGWDAWHETSPSFSRVSTQASSVNSEALLATMDTKLAQAMEDITNRMNERMEQSQSSILRQMQRLFEGSGEPPAKKAASVDATGEAV